jgi:beta-mannosidase
LFVTNDTTKAWNGEVRWSLESLMGERIDQGIENVSAAALAVIPVNTMDFSMHISDGNRRGVVFIAELWKGRNLLARQLATFVPNKHLELVEPQIETNASIAGQQLTVQLKAKSLARFVELEVEGVDVIFSDNYFDLPAGQTVTATCPLPTGWTLEQARAALQIRSLYDSY